MPRDPYRRPPRKPRKYIANLGDRTPLDYGGSIIYQVKGERPRMLHWGSPICAKCDRVECDEHFNGRGIQDRYELYAFDIEDNVATDLNWVDGAEIDRSNGLEEGTWDTYARSEDLGARAQCYLDAFGHYGWANCNGQAPILTRGDMNRYHGRLIRQAMKS